MTNNLISRQAAIDAVNTALFPKINTAKDAEKALRNLPSAQQWIPCSERMPFVDEYGKSDQVLATCGLQGAETSSIRWLRILYFNGCNWCFPTGESYEQMVYAWMPLPKPAKIEV